MIEDRVPMTREGYDKKKGELDHLQHDVMVEVTKRVATAREFGDLSENAEYHAAREELSLLQAKENLLKSQLSRAMIIDTDHLPTGTVAFGSRVTVKDLDLDDEETFELVGPGQENPDKNRILTSSPIAQGLMGKKKGDKVEIEVPSGKIHFKILKIAIADL